ncbi:MAG: pilus assembly protein CpaF [Rhodospirillales bacterium]|jgi:pilus assembly protein CpaE|nr:pilus assembly protein CpaF [Rhodospirillales bacterium]
MSHKITIEAFVLSAATRAAIEEACRDRRLSRSQMSIHDGGLPAALPYYSANHTPNLIVVEEDSDDATMMGQLEKLAEVCDPTTKVVVVGQVNDIRLYRTLISAGVSEYLIGPISARQLLDAVDMIYSDPGLKQRGRVVAFFGVRGGVGSSTVAYNAAWAIAQLGTDDVIVIDLDMVFGTAALSFNQDPKQTLGDAFSNPDRLDATLIERFISRVDDRLGILAAPANVRGFAMIDSAALEKVIEFARGLASFIILDLPHVWLPWVKDALVLADEAVLVAYPDLANLREAKNLSEYLGELRGEGSKPKLVLNRVDPARKTQLTAKDFQEATGLVALQLVANDRVLFETAANNGQMAGEVNANHKAVESLKALALALGAHAPQSKTRGAHAGIQLPDGVLRLWQYLTTKR